MMDICPYDLRMIARLDYTYSCGIAYLSIANIVSITSVSLSEKRLCQQAISGKVANVQCDDYLGATLRLLMRDRMTLSCATI